MICGLFLGHQRSMRDVRKVVLKQGLHSVQWYHLHLRWHLVCLTHNRNDQQGCLWHGLSGMFDLILFHQGKSVDWKKQGSVSRPAHKLYCVFRVLGKVTTSALQKMRTVQYWSNTPSQQFLQTLSDWWAAGLSAKSFNCYTENWAEITTWTL